MADAVPMDRFAAAQAKLDEARRQGERIGYDRARDEAGPMLDAAIREIVVQHQAEIARRDAQWREREALAVRAGHRGGVVHGAIPALLAGAMCVYVALQAGWFGKAAADALEARGRMQPAPLHITEPEDAPRAEGGYDRNPVTGRRIAPPASAP